LSKEAQALEVIGGGFGRTKEDEFPNYNEAPRQGKVWIFTIRRSLTDIKKDRSYKDYYQCSMGTEYMLFHKHLVFCGKFSDELPRCLLKVANPIVWIIGASKHSSREQ